MTQEQINNLIAAYARQLVDNMDMSSLEQYAFDSIVAHCEKLTNEEIVGEIKDYDEELVARFEN